MSPPRIQRLAARVAISLVLGAVIGIGVAWVRINRCDWDESNERSTSAAIERAGIPLVVKVSRFPLVANVLTAWRNVCLGSWAWVKAWAACPACSPS